MKLLRNQYINGQRQPRKPTMARNNDYQTFQIDHNFQKFDVPHYQGHQDPELQTPEVVRISAAEAPQMDEYRIAGILQAIRDGRYKYYVKGGFSRTRRMCLTPGQVARLNHLPMEQCLFEINDIRIESEVELKGLAIVRASSFRTGNDQIRAQSY